MGYLTFVLVILGLIILIFIFQYINSAKSDKLFVLKLNEQYGSINRISRNSDPALSQKHLKYAPDFFHRHCEKGQIDDITWNDLSMDDVFCLIDTTQSDIGSQVLYHILRTPLTDRIEVERRISETSYWMENPETRNGVLLCLHRIGNLKKYSMYDSIDALDDLKPAKISAYIIRLSLLAASVLSMFVLKGIGVIIFLAVLISNIYVYYRDRGQIERYICVIRHGLNVCEAADSIRSILEKNISPFKSEALSEGLGKLAGFRRRGTFDRGLDQGGNPFVIIINLVGMLFFADLFRFWKIRKELLDNRAALEGIIYETGRIDALIAVSSYRAYLGDRACAPYFTGDSRYRASGLFHPLLTDPVPNDIDTDSSILITGSNASGKSTFLKSMALSALFAQCLGFVCAVSYEAPIYVITSAMSVKDDVLGGDSYYMAEIKAVKRMLDLKEQASAEGLTLLCFLDELLNGTNTEERIAASAQILENLDSNGTFVCAATHDIELAMLLEGYEDYHFEENLSEGDVLFSYKIMPGPARTRNAIRLLERIGFPGPVTEAAEKMVEYHSAYGTWQIGKDSND